MAFSFEFNNSINTEQTGNVIPHKSASVSASKDNANTKVTVNGELKYNSNESFITETESKNDSQWLDLEEN